MTTQQKVNKEYATDQLEANNWTFTQYSLYLSEHVFPA